jgi:hypothetical protein
MPTIDPANYLANHLAALEAPQLSTARSANTRPQTFALGCRLKTPLG